MIPTQQIRKTVLWLGVALPLAALLATVWVTHETNGQFSKAFNSVTDTYKVLNQIAETQSHIADAETGRRSYLLTGREDYFAPYATAMAAVNHDILELKGMIQNNRIEQDNLYALQSMVAQQLAVDSEAADSVKDSSTDSLAVELIDEGRDTMNQTRTALYRIREQETQLLHERQQDAESKVIFDQTAQLIMVGVTAIALIAIVAILLRLERLRQIVTVCAWTGQVKHEGEWMRMEEYLKRRFGLSITHGLSREASEKMMEEIHRLNIPADPPPPDKNSGLRLK
jgi:CHASE3 domain sensor protein